MSWALLCVLLSGCGSNDDAISAPNAKSLHAQVDAVRAAAKAGDNDSAQARLAELRSSIRQLSAAGQLDPNDGMVLLGQVDRLAERIDARPTPTPTPTATPAPRVVQAPAHSLKPAKREKHGKGHGKGEDD